MYMQGDEIWHPSCNDVKAPEKIIHHQQHHHHHARHYSPSSKGHRRTQRTQMAEEGDTSGEEEERMQYNPKYTQDFGKHLTYMYLLPEPTMGYLKQPIGPHPPTAPNFHTPKGPVKIRRARVSMLKTGMQRMMEQLESEHPRPKSPHMDNEEPIEMSLYPNAHAPREGDEYAIDREDFPAPPFPYAIEEVRRRLSESEPDDDDDDYGDQVDARHAELLERKKRAAEELKKLEPDSSLIHTVIVNLEEEEKKRRVPLHIDPRSASRTPSAKKLPHFKCRYESATNASPSRYQNRPRPWQHWKEDRSATTAVPFSHMPKPGYGLGPKSSTLPVGNDAYYNGGTFDNDLDTTRESAYSQQSLGESMIDGHGGRIGGTMPMGDSGQRFVPSYGAPQTRSSLPDMSKPIRIYTYDEIMTTNKKLPEDADRCHLERHLPKEDFDRLFKMTPMEFYKLPEWKRVNMKRKAHLF